MAGLVEVAEDDCSGAVPLALMTMSKAAGVTGELIGSLRRLHDARVGAEDGDRGRLSSLLDSSSSALAVIDAVFTCRAHSRPGLAIVDMLGSRPRPTGIDAHVRSRSRRPRRRCRRRAGIAAADRPVMTGVIEIGEHDVLRRSEPPAFTVTVKAASSPNTIVSTTASLATPVRAEDGIEHCPRCSTRRGRCST